MWRNAKRAGAIPQGSDAMTFQEFQQEGARLRAALYAASDRLKALPGVGTGATGLTPDSVKTSREYREAARAFDSALRALQSFNAKHLKAHKVEHAQAMRAARVERAA
jgi:hypothetical protein